MADISHSSWETELERISRSAAESVSAAATLESVEEVRVSLLGRKGSLTAMLKALKDLPLEEKRRCGPQANTLRDSLQQALDARRTELERAGTEAALSGARIDLTLPAAPMPRGRLHPITRTIREITGALSQLGFSLADGPLIETERYNFEALNIPAEHPARDMQDTFYLAGTRTPLLLRTHTSPVQVRWMEKHAPPVRIIAPGRVFRHEAVDASHSAVFHQIEGLYVDKRVTMADLKWTLTAFLRKLFGPKTAMRFHPSYFPFTEPSAEVFVSCLLCGGKGCPVCKRSGWIEMLGAGLVNPAVLRNVGYDPERWSGFAFGVGVERIALLRYGIPDIRLLYENDLRFLEQFGP